MEGKAVGGGEGKGSDVAELIGLVGLDLASDLFDEFMVFMRLRR